MNYKYKDTVSVLIEKKSIVLSSVQAESLPFEQARSKFILIVRIRIVYIKHNFLILLQANSNKKDHLTNKMAELLSILIIRYVNLTKLL